MLKTINIIGDVAGRHQTLLKLLDLMPPADLTILAGDLVDRGPKSYEVLKMVDGVKIIAILGNHEAMMRLALASEDDALGRQRWWWTTRNGGDMTLKSLIEHGIYDHDSAAPIIKLVDSMPIFFRQPGLLITHAPAPSHFDAADFVDNEERSIWNRDVSETPVTDPETGEALFNIFGHNGKHVIYKKDDKAYAMCIDDSHRGALVGVQWPSLQTYRIEGID